MPKKKDNSSMKISYGSVTSNPISDYEILYNEGKKVLTISGVCFLFDTVIVTLLIFYDCNFFTNKEEKNLKNFTIFITITIILMFVLFVLLLIRNIILAQISRYTYIIIGCIVYAFQIVFRLISLCGEEESEDIEIVFFFLNVLSIIPRPVAFLYIKIYTEIIGKMKAVELAEEHQGFMEKISDKIDRSAIKNNEEKLIIQNDDYDSYVQDVKKEEEDDEDDVDQIDLKKKGKNGPADNNNLNKDNRNKGEKNDNNLVNESNEIEE